MEQHPLFYSAGMISSAESEYPLQQNTPRIYGMQTCVEPAIAKLKSLHDGHRGLVEIVRCGRCAIPALRALLLEREPSGIFQPRCLTVKALVILGARDVLIEFLRASRATTDPVERLGDDAVVNAAARALADLHEPEIFELMLALAHKRRLSGVLAALSCSKRPEGIPYLVDALAEDECRPVAEVALRSFGSAARKALIVVAAAKPIQPAELDSISRIRQRRSALRLLGEIGIPSETWPVLRHLLQEDDAKTFMLTAKICLASAPSSEKKAAILHLIKLMWDAGPGLGQEIEQCLATHFDIAKPAVEAYVATLPPGDPMRACFRRVEICARTLSQEGRTEKSAKLE